MSGPIDRPDSGNGFSGDQESLRLRRAPAQMSYQNYPQYNWSSNPSDDEVGNAEPPRELRTLAGPMAQKKALRQVQQMRTPVSTSAKSWTHNKTKSLRKLKSNIRESLYFFSLWRKSLQKIGGNFGGGVESYFLFLRFLVVLNFVSFLLIAGFVIVPSLVFRSAGTTLNSTDGGPCMKYNPNPQGLVVFYEFFLHLLSGQGFMENSLMFYGYYNNNTAMEDGRLFYNIPLAYLFTAVFYFAFCLCCIIARMGTAARVVVATGGSTMGNYSMIVFTGWDYGCLGDQATKLKQRNIYYRLQVDLEEERIKKQAASLTAWRKVALYSLRVLMFFISIGLIVAAFYGIFVATDFSQKNSEKPGILGLVIEYLPSMVITAGNFLVPLLCDQIALIEKYSPTMTVVVALLRAVVLRMVSLGVLLFTLWRQITCDGNTDAMDCKTCQYNDDKYPCWETRLGQEMYKLMLFDFLVTVALLVLVEFPRRMVVDNWSSKLSQLVGRQEFVVPSNVLGLVYGQTVVWTGALFCPLLPLINTVKFILLFYCKKITLFYNCRPALKTFRSTTSTFFFLAVLLFGWILSLVVMIYSLAVIHPSMACGPFRFISTMWQIVPNSFYSLSKVTQEFLFFIGSQAFSIPLFVLSCVVMFYFIALASIYGRSVAMLKAQLKLEGHDKQFLVKQIEKMKSSSL